MHLITILLIDDNKAFRSEVLEYLGSQPAVKAIAEATSGVNGIRLASRLNPDVILIDMNMPGMDGLETAKRLKEQGCRSKVVVLTMHQDETYLELMKSPHVDSVISKSSLWRDMQRIIRTMRAEPDSK